VLQTVLFLMCAGNELFFVMAYVVYHTAGPLGTIRVCGAHAVFRRSTDLFPCCALHARPLRRAAVNLGIATVPLYHLIAYATLPVCVVKQLLSVIQLIGASQQLAQIDRSERKATASKRKA